MGWLKKLCLFSIITCIIFSTVGCVSIKNDDYDVDFFVEKFEMLNTFQDIASDFEKETGYKVKVESPSKAATIINDRVRNDVAPDIFQVYPGQTAYNIFQREGKLRDVTSLSCVKNIDKSALDMYEVKDKLRKKHYYTLPLSFSCEALYYNETLFHKYGYDKPELYGKSQKDEDKNGQYLPRTWQDMEKLASKVNQDKKGGVNKLSLFALSGSDPYLIHGMHEALWQQVLGSTDSANRYFLNSPKGEVGKYELKISGKELSMNEANGYDSAFNKVSDILTFVADNSQSNYGTAKAADAITALVKEQGLIFPAGTFSLPLIRQAKPKDKIKTMPFPGTTDDNQAIISTADLSLSVSNHVKNMKAVEAFLNYLTSPKVFQKYYDVDGNKTSVKGVKTKGRTPELEGIEKLYTDPKHHVPWIHQYWKQGESPIQTLTINFMITKNKNDLYNSLNQYFDVEKRMADEN
ncbi:raffinose/stachyose/melibiose transport system substrate-binding protein [Clostridium acetobutylicum]|uniref:ABC-type sugar transport system, periplasmic sugar-binding component n=1 Tax=Clostridium acetobutylicum (strain ATCC 824 / DSM 792 / JCM 1419 / IAM 19013 / LMG 5710 / NBRC 13948 / NRRL B-527 / VKM B-1787 / 2291 / W) TaxID=272562 RepID=Q97D11_CLOAB|nr:MULTISPECIES: ABC transporter substrate-binding protein [Clostridium]AAK81593.1 ABC-type sugar transport system, periplasmic sugar-binding component [Clostridium acetobutylicum ATCC 824]ADZ22716.1 ABC-type sugar transport system, periplasmic sugar-binding component [Clostridium acetobutylicum EA 2018]AEI33757.1 ABC-type sugar transport system, periplasmic sugar-binding component [Clostridium acetobutylicum DSM 1731]AWV80732.1 carbohydrate ABC transporter substrate-binding protein [Clostridiu